MEISASHILAERRGWNAVIPGHSTKDSHEDAPLFLLTTDKKKVLST